MAYTTLLKRLSRQSKQQYYTALIEHRHELLKEVSQRGQMAVAKEIKMSQAKLSATLTILNTLNRPRHTLYYITENNTHIVGLTQNMKELLDESEYDTYEIYTWRFTFDDASRLLDSILERYQPTMAGDNMYSLYHPLSPNDIDMLDCAGI